MPRRDGSGPMGYGPLTGRGMGFCARPSGYGMGWGYGMGRGWRSGYGAFPPMTGQQSLDARKKMLEEELKQVETLLAQERQE